jgi:hypothetical protein
MLEDFQGCLICFIRVGFILLSFGTDRVFLGFLL